MVTELFPSGEAGSAEIVGTQSGRSWRQLRIQSAGTKMGFRTGRGSEEGEASKNSPFIDHWLFKEGLHDGLGRLLRAFLRPHCVYSTQEAN